MLNRVGYPGRIGITPGTSIPSPDFVSDTDSYHLDFQNVNNIEEQTGDRTLSSTPEKLRDAIAAANSTKDLQPLVSANGVNFNKDTGRQLRINDISGITNDSNGWYIALNCRVDTTDSNIMSIARNVSATASRGQIYIPSNRQFGFKAANNDGGTPIWICRGPAVNLGQWYTLEMQWDLTNDTVTIWYDGVQQTNAVVTTALAMANFPATDPSEITIGNWSESDSDSFDGEIQNLIFHDGVPTNTIRQSISSYLTGVRP